MLAFAVLITILQVNIIHSYYQVQEEEVIFYLNTRQLSDFQLTKDNLCEIDADKEVIFMTHGWNSNHQRSWIGDLTAAYLAKGDYNIIHIDWSILSTQISVISVPKTVDAGYYVAKQIRRIAKRLSVPLDRIQLIGHSLGVHLLGFAGKYVQDALGAKVAKLTGMDAADVEYDGPPELDGVHRDDAGVVLIIHTDDSGMGRNGSRGSVDFYANGGLRVQPGCSETEFGEDRRKAVPVDRRDIFFSL